MKRSVGSRRPKGSGLIGMGRGDLARGGGITLKKPLPSTVIQEKNDQVSAKTRKIEKSQASFAMRARSAKYNKNEDNSS
jgi:hypothetical protein